jgi:hypothetical protein
MYHRPRDADPRLDVYPFDCLVGPHNHICRARIDEFGYFHYPHPDRDLGSELALSRLGGESCQCIKDWRTWSGHDRKSTLVFLAWLRPGLARRRRLVDPDWDVNHAGLVIVDILRRRGWPLIPKSHGWALLPIQDDDVAFGIDHTDSRSLDRLRQMGVDSCELERREIGGAAYSLYPTFQVHYCFDGINYHSKLPITPVGIARAVVLLEAYLVVALQARVDRCFADAHRRRFSDLAISYLVNPSCNPNPCVPHLIVTRFVVDSLTAGSTFAEFSRGLVALKKQFPGSGSDHAPQALRRRPAS